MRTLKFKTTGELRGQVARQHPLVEVGWDRDHRVLTYEVTDIPDEVTDARVERLLDTSVVLGVYSIRYEQLGVGRIIRTSGEQARGSDH